MKTMRRLLVGVLIVLIAGMAVEGFKRKPGPVKLFTNNYLKRLDKILGPRPELEGVVCSDDRGCNSGECCTKYKRCRPMISGEECYPFKILNMESCPCEGGMKCQVYRHLQWNHVMHQKGTCVPEDEYKELELKTYDEWTDKDPSGIKKYLGNKWRNQIGFTSGVLGRGRKRRSVQKNAH
ncbi:uncharacterized protein LOC144873220 [Branchiostoma floridae x Branchiostoma japonicum]